MRTKEIDYFCPANQKEWREWLKKNHEKKEAVWLIFYKKSSPTPNLSWSEAVDEALCFGWIDSVKKRIDSEKYQQYFGKRKAKSTWSKVNKDKIEKLIQMDLLAEAGFESIKIAKENGSWNILDTVEKLEIPSDLEQEFNKYPEAKVFFLSLSKSVRKGMLYWLVDAKRPTTREKRIKEIIRNACLQQKPKQFR